MFLSPASHTQRPEAASLPANQPPNHNVSFCLLPPTPRDQKQPASQPTNQPTIMFLSVSCLPHPETRSSLPNQPANQPTSHPPTHPSIMFLSVPCLPHPETRSSQPASQPTSQPTNHNVSLCLLPPTSREQKQPAKPTNQPTNQPPIMFLSVSCLPHPETRSKHSPLQSDPSKAHRRRRLLSNRLEQDSGEENRYVATTRLV